jgi:hypothetical protein
VRNLNELNRFRCTWPEIIAHYGNAGDDTCGVFQLKSGRGEEIRVIASSGEGWDHVSVSLEKRCPTWEEMEQVKRMFFKDDETAMQLHVPPSAHISHHPYCLHIWRPSREEIPMPPDWMVGPKTQEPVHG